MWNWFKVLHILYHCNNDWQIQSNVPGIIIFCQCIISYNYILMWDFRELFQALHEKWRFANGRTLDNPLSSPFISLHKRRSDWLVATSTCPIIFHRFFYPQFWLKRGLCMRLWAHWLGSRGCYWCFHFNLRSRAWQKVVLFYQFFSRRLNVWCITPCLFFNLLWWVWARDWASVVRSKTPGT